MLEHKIIITEINDGFVVPRITDTDYIFGDASIPDVIVKPNGQWDDSLPANEIQARGFDTFGCTAWGSTNQAEIFEKGALSLDKNYSDRALYISANIAPPGADPAQVYENIRKKGLVNEQDLPWSDNIKTIEEYSSPKPLPNELVAKADEWLLSRVFKHDYLP